ncbi:hypothetical protein Tco_1189800 [Tanacetum coccineum]
MLEIQLFVFPVKSILKMALKLHADPSQHWCSPSRNLHAGETHLAYLKPDHDTWEMTFYNNINISVDNCSKCDKFEPCPDGKFRNKLKDVEFEWRKIQLLEKVTYTALECYFHSPHPGDCRILKDVVAMQSSAPP